MSAIWGIVSLDNNDMSDNNNSIFEQEYRKKCKIDNYQSIKTDHACFGCGIQYITEESKKEVLPIYDKERGILFTADCILDNRSEIITLLDKKLEKEYLITASDGMLMYYVYIYLGMEYIKYFRGLFTIAIWNEKSNSLILVSDQVSARCLYYIKRDNIIVFSTLLSPIKKYFFDIENNEKYYKDFLLADHSLIYIVPGETPYKEVKLMLPATYVAFTADSTKSHTYWMPADNKPAIKGTSAKDYATAFMNLYNECIADALRTDGEIGIAMSSGLDSASIGAIAAQQLDNKQLKSYTFVPYEKIDNTNKNSIYDESDLVNEIAKMYPNIKTTFLNNHGKNIFEDMDLCAGILEMPYKTGTFPNHYEMCRLGAKEGCKVFLNGGFGNSTVSYGYINHILYDLYINKKYFKLLSYLNKYAKHEKLGRMNMLKKCMKSFKSFSQYNENPLNKFIPENPFISRNLLNDYNLIERFSNDKRTLAATGYIDKKRYADYLNATGLLMYLGVFETKFGLNTNMLLRDPTKDIRLISFCYHMPYHLFAYKGKTRWLIRYNFENLLPESILGKWKQHALLNVDWVNRVERDWNEVKPDLINNLNTGNLNDYLLNDDIRYYLKNIDFKKEKDRNNLINVCAIDCLLTFIKQQNE